MPRIKGAGWKSGDIKIHTGTLETIPSGWQLCDGTNGTPELVDRAVVGAGRGYSQNEQFGGDKQRPAKPSVSVNKPSVTVNNHTLSIGQAPSKHIEFGVSGGSNSPVRLYRCSALHGSTNVGGSNQSHGHGVSVGNITANVGDVGEVDTRQQSIAVYWIMKL